MQQWTYFLGGLGTFISLTVAAAIAWKKLKPESTNIHVMGAASLVEVAIKTTGMIEEQRDDLVREMAEFRMRMTALEERAHAAEERAASAERRVAMLEDDIARIREAKTKVAEENLVLKERVKHLEEEVERLRDMLNRPDGKSTSETTI